MLYCTMRMSRVAPSFFAAVLLLAPSLLCAQLVSPAKADGLSAYRTCGFSDGLQLVQIDPLAPGVTARTVETADGIKAIQMIEGNRLLYAYPNTDIFANVKVEVLPSASWTIEKKFLRQNFAYMMQGSPEFKSDKISYPSMLRFDAIGGTKNSISAAYWRTTFFLTILNMSPYPSTLSTKIQIPGNSNHSMNFTRWRPAFSMHMRRA